MLQPTTFLTLALGVVICASGFLPRLSSRVSSTVQPGENHASGPPRLGAWRMASALPFHFTKVRNLRS